MSNIGGLTPQVTAASIMLVDDETDILPEYQELMEAFGYSALTESDPEAALSTIVRTPEIKVLVTDLKMAKMDGIGLIDAVRSNVAPDRNIQFIVVSGDAARRSLLDDPDIPVLLKPLDLDAFLSAIRKAMADAQ